MRYKSRKFLAWAALVVLSTVLLWFGKLEGPHWVDVCVPVTFAYAFSNAIQAIGLAFGARKG